MSSLIVFPVRVLGWAAVGFALAVGWKLGSELVRVALDKKELKWPESKTEVEQPQD